MYQKIIYVEWLDEQKKFHNDFFYSWDEFHEKFFNPCLELLAVKECK